MKRTVDLNNIFSEKFSQIIKKYVKRLNVLLKQYDAVIFMARKSICFYSALIIQGEIEKSTECCIMSSRALEYNVLKRYVGKKVALIDDVVVKGTSITKAMNNLKEAGIKPDIYIAACDIDFIQNESFEYKGFIRHPYVILNEQDICELATFITEYIAASGCPYNIDQPIYKIYFRDHDEVEHFFALNKYVDITSSTQQQFGICSRVTHFKSTMLKNIFPEEIPLEHVYVKIRMIYNKVSGEMLLLPFVLLPEIDYSLVEKLYELVSTPALDDIIKKTNIRTEYENKLNIFQYIFSNVFIKQYFKEILDELTSKKVKSNEIAQFSQCLFEENELDQKANMFFEGINIIYNQESSYIDSFLFNEYVSKVYDLVLGKNSVRKYINSSGSEIAKNVISVNILEAYIKKCNITYDKYALSNLIDIFIDRGIFIPSVVHTKNHCIVRAYKGGEVAKISEKEMELFSHMLGQYLDYVGKDNLDKIEYEKLCVLFFRSAAKKDIFPNVQKEKIKAVEGDYFEVSYAKFGPRVSVAQGKRYEAGQKSLLADEMTELELLNLRKGTNDKGEYIEKYCVVDWRKDFEDNTWSDFANIVAYDFAVLRKCYRHGLSKKAEEERHLFEYVPSYNKFLTLLAIGNNEKERLLSLAAEIYLFLSVQIEGLTAKRSLLKIRDKFDGICSGIWKYVCYKNDSLLEKLFRSMSKYNKNVVRSSIDYLSKSVDRNPNIIDYIDECGDFLIALAYNLNKMGKVYNIKFAETHSDFNYIPPEKLMELESIDNGDFDDEKIERSLQEFKLEAGALIDKCDIFLKEEAMFYKICKTIFIIYSGTTQLPDALYKQAIKHSLGENKIDYNYLLLNMESEISLENQLGEIIDNCQDVRDVKIVLCNMQKDYEGIIYGRNISKGRNFDKFAKEILDQENSRPFNNRMEFIVYSKENKDFSNINLEGFQLCRHEDIEVQHGYFTQRFYIIKNHNHSQNDVKVSLNVKEAGEVKIGEVNNSRIIESNGPYYEGSIELKQEDVQLAENLKRLADELEILKTKVEENQIVVIDNAIKDVNSGDTSKIKEGLKQIGSLGKNVLSSVMTTTVVAYMKYYGILPPV